MQRIKDGLPTVGHVGDQWRKLRLNNGALEYQGVDQIVWWPAGSPFDYTFGIPEEEEPEVVVFEADSGMIPLKLIPNGPYVFTGLPQPLHDELWEKVDACEGDATMANVDRLLDALKKARLKT